MTDWTPGMACRVVEHDPASRQPKTGGRVFPATVTSTGTQGTYVGVTVDSDTSIGVLGPVYFWAGSGWKAWDGDFRWRLLPGTGEGAASAAGED